jgi:hypothetical protein
MDSSSILKTFNNHFEEFVNDVQSVFPEDTEILTCKNSVLAIRKANPTMIIKIWRFYIANKYENEINSGDISFFLNKDYNDDLSYMDEQNTRNILNKINILREPIRNMGPENQSKSMKYIQNLTKLSKMYNK